MKLNLVIAGALFAGLTGSALAIGAKENFYIYHDMSAKKCSIVKENPNTGTVGTGEIFDSEQAAQAALDKMPECANSGK
jgi:hypothetical protein